jgi:hypothetical protein
VKVYVFPADLHGCGHYRLIWPARVLQRAGYSISIIPPKERDKMLQGRMRGDMMVDVVIPEDADVIIFQRVTHRLLVSAIELIRKRGVAVVIDMDDDLSCIHPAHPAFHALHPSGPNPDHSWRNPLLACENATLVTVSTPALLQRYAPHGRGQVLYNMIPERMLTLKHEDSDVIGWAGSVFSHPTDLQTMGPSIAQLLQSGRRFKIAGPIQGVHAAIGVTQGVDIESTGPVDLEAWPLAINSLGIGVAPLADSKFNAAKSWLKMAEYAAVGVPCVASSRIEYVRLHKKGVGLLARTSGEWRAKLQLLTSSVDARLDLAARGREVVEGLTIERNAWRWWEAWSDALRRQRSNPLSRANAA